MKSILILSATLAIITACGDNKVEQKVEDKRQNNTFSESKSKTLSDSSSTKNAEQKQPNNKISVVDLVGNWEQVKTEPVGNDVVTGVITVKLMLNGDFIASAKTSSKFQKPQNSPEQTGKWTLYGNTVSLSGMRKLEYNSNTQKLVDEVNKVELTRQ